jgi:acyl-coenzyme A synthetase/AMP-(fatty) acid ligase
MHTADMIFFWAKSEPERPALVQSDMVVTYGEFAEAIAGVSERILGFDLDRSKPVAVSIDHPIRQLAVCFALWRLGFTVALAPRGTILFLRSIGIENVIFAGEGQMLSGGRNIQYQDTWLKRQDRKPLPWDPARPSQASTTPLVFFTSGTTGTPKKVIVPAEALLDRIALLPITGEGNCRRILVLPDISSMFGFTRVMVRMHAGLTCCFARGAQAQLGLVNTFGIDQIVGSPQQIIELVRVVEEGGQPHVDSLREIRIGGGFTSGSLVRRVQTALCGTVITEYGATETGILAFGNYDTTANVPNSVGFLVPGLQLEIVDDADIPVPLGERGRIRFRSSYLAKVQDANTPDVNEDHEARWWYPGDIGYTTADGILCVEGRADDVINCGGVKFSGERLDEAVRTYPKVRDAGVCGIRGPSGIEELWIGVAADGVIDVSKMKQWFELNNKPIIVGRILMLDNIPRNALGKLQRHLLKEALIESGKQGKHSSATA